MKSIFQSKTFWLNVAALVLGYITTHTTALLGLGITPAILGAVVAILNIGVRFLTVEPVNLGGRP